MVCARWEASIPFTAEGSGTLDSSDMFIGHIDDFNIHLSCVCKRTLFPGKLAQEDFILAPEGILTFCALWFLSSKFSCCTFRLLFIKILHLCEVGFPEP